MTRRLRLWPWVPLFLATGWLAGLLGFAAGIPRGVKDETTRTDAIIVLTGGSERLEAGLALLRQGMAQKLFVSGVYVSVDVAELLRMARQKPEEVECCIILGHAADNTLGNAHETAEWMKREGFHSLRLVTGGYHMPRSLSEFHHAMPEVTIVPHPVFPDSVKRERWWLWPGTAHLIVSEYLKFLAGKMRHFAESQEIVP